MMLLCILITLALLAISINISEKVFYIRRKTKATTKSPYAKPTYVKRHRSQYYKYLIEDNFLIGHFMNRIRNKKEEKNSQAQNKYKKKNNNRIIQWPKH